MIVKNCELIKPLSCKESTTVEEVAKTLREKRQRRIFVVDDSGNPVGIISTTDVSNRLVAQGKDPKTTKAKEIMTKDVVVCEFEEDLSSVYTKMTESECFFCPVVKEGKIYGVLTYGEMMQRAHSQIEK